MHQLSIVLLLILPAGLLLSFLNGLLGLHNSGLNQTGVLLGLLGLPAFVIGLILYFASKRS